ncbi:MAG: hypothetical protein ACR2J3_06010, partial [Aridibacter sp.]
IVVSLLSPYFAKTGGKFAEKMGEKLSDRNEQIYKVIKEKFQDDEYAGLTLLRLQDTPENEVRKSALKNVLNEKFAEDSHFAEVLQMLIKDAKKFDSKNIIASGERSVAIGGNTESSTIITGDNSTKNDKIE